MGMICSLYRISNEKIDLLNEDPSLAYLYTAYDDDTEFYVSMKKNSMKQKSKPTFFQKLFGKKVEPVDETAIEIPEVNWIEGEKAETDLDKAWNLIHFGLSEATMEGEWPKDFLLNPEKSVFFNGDDGVTCFAYNAEQISEINSFLKDFTTEQLIANINKMSENQKAEVYLGDYWDSEDSDEVEYVTDGFDGLKSFIGESAKLGFGVLFYIG